MNEGSDAAGAGVSPAMNPGKQGDAELGGHAAATADERLGPIPVSDLRRILGVATILLPTPLVIGTLGAGFQLRLFSTFVAFATLTVALNIVFAHTDQLFLFVGGLLGVGAYATALPAQALGVTAWLTLPFGVLLVGAVGALVSYVAARRGMTVIVLAILTLSLQLAATEFFIGAGQITGGSTGFPFEGFGFATLGDALVVPTNVVVGTVLVVVLLTALVGYSWLRSSRFGLAFAAVRRDPVAAETVGINAVQQKTIAGFIGAALIGLVGPLYAGLQGFITPSLFTFQAVDVLVLVMLVLGGMRTLLGPVVGAGLVIALEEFLVDFGQWRGATLGFLLILLFLYFRRGVVPALAVAIRPRIPSLDRE